MPSDVECVQGVTDGSEMSALPEEKGHLPSWGPEGYLQQGAEPEPGKAGGQTGEHWKNV